MKKALLPFLILIALFYACGEKTNKKDANNITNSNTSKKDELIIYEKKESCDTFIAGIDFSSFCFTSKATPKYRLIQDNERNCQYKLYDNKSYQNIDFSIAFADFNGFKGNKELSETVFLNVFKRKKNSRMVPSGSKEINGLGDDAYIGYNQSEDNKEQYLGVRVGNVTFTLVFKHGKGKSQQSCMQAEQDLIKIGQFVIDNIKK